MKPETTETIIAAALEIKEKLKEHAVDVPCSNPACSNIIQTTAKQKRDFSGGYRKQYGKTVLPCCSTECRDVVFSMMS